MWGGGFWSTKQCCYYVNHKCSRVINHNLHFFFFFFFNSAALHHTINNSLFYLLHIVLNHFVVVILFTHSQCMFTLLYLFLNIIFYLYNLLIHLILISISKYCLNISMWLFSIIWIFLIFNLFSEEVRNHSLCFANIKDSSNIYSLKSSLLKYWKYIFYKSWRKKWLKNLGALNIPVSQFISL